MCGLTVSLGELLTMGAENIEAHARSLAKLMREKLTDTNWTPFRSIDDRAASAHIIALENPSADVEKTVKVLREKNIVCSSRNNRIRVSIAHFNNEADICALAKILRQV